MKKALFLIYSKSFLLPTCLFMFCTTDSTETVHRLPIKYSARKTTSASSKKKLSPEMSIKTDEDEIITVYPNILKPKETTTTFPLYLRIQPQDGDVIEVPQDILELSNIITSMLLDLGNSVETIIPIPYSRSTLTIIFRDILPRYKKATTKNIASSLEEVAKRFNLEELIDITNALNYLDIRAKDNSDQSSSVLSIFIKKIFDVIINLTPQEVTNNRNILNKLVSDIRKRMVDICIIPFLKSRMLKLNQNNRIVLSNDSFNCLAISPDGKTIVASDKNENLTVWDTESYKQITSLEGHDSRIETVSFNHEGTLIASGDINGNLILWNTSTYKKQNFIKLNGEIYTLAFSPDNTKIISGGTSDALTVRDINTLEEVRYLTSYRDPETYLSLFSPDGKQIVYVDKKRNTIISIYNAETYQDFGFQPDNRGNTVNAIEFSSDSKKLFSAGANRSGLRNAGNIVVWDTPTYKELNYLTAMNGEVISIDLGRNGTLVAYSTLKNEIGILNTQTDKILTKFDLPENSHTKIALNPDNTKLISCSSEGNGGLMIWNLVNQDDLEKLSHFNNYIATDSYIEKIIVVHKLCSALEKNTKVKLTDNELTFFNKILLFDEDEIKEILIGGIDNNETRPATAPQSTNVIDRLRNLWQSWWSSSTSK